MEQEIITQKEVKRERFRSLLWHATMFYSFLLVLVLGVLLVMHSIMTPLENWLEQYEAARSHQTEAEIYELLFEDPDWALLYSIVGIEDTQFEGKDAFASYMESKIGDDTLQYVETPTGLNAHRRFSLRHQGTEIGYFTMVPKDSDRFGITQWTLGEVDLYFTRTQSVSVILLPGQTAYINNVPLDDSYTTYTVATLAEEYTEEELHGLRYFHQTITGLLVQPTVTVLDENLQPVPLTQDPETGIYRVELPTPEPTPEDKYAFVLAAAKAEALFSIRQINASQLRQHFDPSASAYADLLAMSAVASDVASYQLEDSDITITGYCRHSQTLYTVYVQTSLDVTDSSGQVQTVTTSITYFISPNSTGHDTVIRRLDADLQQQTMQVRLTYLQGSTTLESTFVDTRTTQLTPPAVAGAIGWGKMESDGSITTVLELQEDGTFRLADGQTLSPMTLYPILEGN